ncbi:MAG: ArnT family glycosyltransferase [Candidatus Komeilibacteria bacterium]
MNLKIKHTISVWTLLSIIGLCLFVTLTYWNSFNTPFERDEGEYAYSAWLLDQNITPYENSFLQKPPMIIYTYWLAYKINPDALWPARAIAFVFTILTIFIISLIVKKELGNKMALLAAWLATLMMSLPHLSLLAANTERFMLLPLVTVLALYVYNKDNNKKWPWVLAGAYSAIALLYKPIVLFVLIFIFLVWLYQNWNRSKDLKQTLFNILLILIGSLSATFIILIPFLIKSVCTFMWESIVHYNAQYAQHMKKYIPSALISNIKILWSIWPALFILFIWYLIKRPKQWWFYLSLLLISLLTIFTSPIRHYYLLIMPFWIIISITSIKSLLDKIKINKYSADWQRVIIFLSSSIIIISMILPIQKQYFLSPQELNVWVYGYSSPFAESQTVANKIKEITGPEDKIFIAGSEPQIYYYSKRLSSSRFIITYPLNIETPSRENYQTLTVENLKNDSPEVIVISRLQTSSLWEEGSPYIFLDYINNIINNDYILIGGYVWDNNIGNWQEPINTQEEFNASSLLMYKKK